MKNYNDFVLNSSIVLLERKFRKNLYEDLVEFNITNKYIINDLKNRKIQLKLIPDSIKDINFSNKSLFVNKLVAYDKNYSTYVYDIGLK